MLKRPTQRDVPEHRGTQRPFVVRLSAALA